MICFLLQFSGWTHWFCCSSQQLRREVYQQIIALFQSVSLEAIKFLEKTLNMLHELYGLHQLSDSCSIQPIHSTHWLSRFSSSLKHVHKIIFLLLPPSHYFCFRLVIFCCLGGQEEVSRYQDKQSWRERRTQEKNVVLKRWWKPRSEDKRLYASSKGRWPQPRPDWIGVALAL